MEQNRITISRKHYNDLLNVRKSAKILAEYICDDDGEHDNFAELIRSGWPMEDTVMYHAHVIWDRGNPSAPRLRQRVKEILSDPLAR